MIIHKTITFFAPFLLLHLLLFLIFLYQSHLLVSSELSSISFLPLSHIQSVAYIFHCSTLSQTSLLSNSPKMDFIVSHWTIAVASNSLTILVFLKLSFNLFFMIQRSLRLPISSEINYKTLLIAFTYLHHLAFIELIFPILSLFPFVHELLTVYYFELTLFLLDNFIHAISFYQNALINPSQSLNHNLNHLFYVAFLNHTRQKSSNHKTISVHRMRQILQLLILITCVLIRSQNP